MLALDVILLCMITVCIIYCWILNQRIRDLHNSRIEFARMIKEFDSAVIKAEHCIDDLSTLGKSANDQVKKSTKAAEEVIEDLTSIYEVGDKTCSNLEAAISEARKCQKILETSKATKSSKKSSSKKKAVKVTKDDVGIDEAESVDMFAENSYIEDTELPEHQNLLERVLSRIVTNKEKTGKYDQNDYYSSLKKVSLRK